MSTSGIPPIGNNTPATTNIPAMSWAEKTLPRRILAIRLQAMGDVAIALPYLQHLRNVLPTSVKFDFLTRKETEDIPKNLILFDSVFAIGGGRRVKIQWLFTFFLMPRLLFRRYDVVLDLQNNVISRFVRKALRPMAWSEFDRFSPIAAAERYRLTIDAAGVVPSKAATKFKIRDPLPALSILKSCGWEEQESLVALNPAGAFSTRNWPLANFVTFARLWMEKFPLARFIVIGTPFIASKASYLKEQLGAKLINLTGKTNPAEAFSIVQHLQLMLSEDSGLMHMAWVSGIPTVALFGSTRSDWARPLGEHSSYLDSSDLPCGNCMLTVCKYGDVHCLTRFSPEMVFQACLSVFEKVR